MRTMLLFSAVLVLNFLCVPNSLAANPDILFPDEAETRELLDQAQLEPVVIDLESSPEGSEQASQEAPLLEDGIELDEVPELDDHTGDLSSHRANIPEPMVFDLVRPLGAKRGELEMNTLFLSGLDRRRGAADWAPEIEYAFRDGMAVELEFPFETASLQSLKVALQGTLPSRNERLIHGIQLFKEYDLHHKKVDLTEVYILGYRFTPKISVLTVQGVRQKHLGRRTTWQGLMNMSLFYKFSDKVTLGMEANAQLDRKKSRFLYIPQLHLELSRNYSLQMGGGVSQYKRNRFSPAVGIRLIRTL